MDITDIADKFWSKVNTGLENECWEWQGYRAKTGYGVIQARKISPMPMLAHRIAYELSNGAIEKGLHVLHECDNPPCCNPKHLFLGTQVDNNKDRDKKNRVASGSKNGAKTKPEQNPFIKNGGSGKKGEQHPMSILSEIQVKAIRTSSSKNGISNVELSRMYHVSQTHIGRIIKRKIWKDLSD